MEDDLDWEERVWVRDTSSLEMARTGVCRATVGAGSGKRKGSR